MNRLKIAKIGYILMSLVFYAAGFSYLILPKMPVRMLCIIGGIVLIVYGIIKIIGYFSNDLYCLAFQYDLSCGLLLIILGIIVMKYNLYIQQYFSPGLGFLILFDSLMKIQIAYDAHMFGLERWYLIFIFSVITGIFGILIIISYFSSMDAARIINGCGILIEGLMNHIFILNTVKIWEAHNQAKENEQL